MGKMLLTSHPDKRLGRTAPRLTPGDARLRLLAGAFAQFLHGMQAPRRILQTPSLVALILQGGEDLPGVQKLVRGAFRQEVDVRSEVLVILLAVVNFVVTLGAEKR